MDIFVGSLSFKIKESELREAFEKYGVVNSVKIVIDKITRQSKGFGFLEMPDEEQARLAISQLNGAEMHGRPLVVNEAQKKDAGPPRPQRDDRPPRANPSGDRFASRGTDSPRPERTSSSESDSKERVFRDANKVAGGGKRDYGRERERDRKTELKKAAGSKKPDTRRGRGGNDFDDWG